MAEETVVQIFTPTPCGVQNAAPPMAREPLLIPTPCYIYEKVREVKFTDPQNKHVIFVNRQGDEIESVGMPYLIKRTRIAEGNA